MTPRFYNSLTQRQEPFQPLDSHHVRMYACGPTVYDHIHVGNARPIVVFDVVFRLFQALYPRVTYVRNITDVDDKILVRAQERGLTPEQLTEETIGFLNQDILPLHTLPPTHQPRATEYIGPMIHMIQTLVDRGHAYEAEGHVLFAVHTDAAYGSLSKCDEATMQAGARVEVASYKKSPYDFVLWKPAPEGAMGWASPWGYGRPGWHIECSAMSASLLGIQFDLHAGGLDLKFPHHENERAQSRCAHQGQEMAHTWLHNGFITMSGQKMSKSLGHFVKLNEALAQYRGSVIRYFFLNTHYRHTLDWSDELLEAAHASLNRLYMALRPYEEVLRADPEPLGQADGPLLHALCDDLNTPYALHLLHQEASSLNRRDASSAEEQRECAQKMWRWGRFLGLFSESISDWFHQGAPREQVEALIHQRQEARKRKDFQTADQVRQQLNDLGVVLEDQGGKTLWRFDPRSSAS